MSALFLALAAGALALPGDTASRKAAAAAQEAPAVVVHRQPETPVVALRLSLLADDPPGYAGAGHLFQHLQLPALEEQAARVGGRVQATRTADAVIYTVVGPARELDHLAAMLRDALRAPAAGSTELLAALRDLGQERDAERETAPRFVRAALRASVFPDEPPAAGTTASSARLETARLPEVWAAMYRPERVSVIAVGDVLPEAVRRAFQGLPAAGQAALEELADSVPGFSGAVPPQATRAWLGSAWRAPGADAPALSVAARLLQGSLRRRLPAAQVEVEHWWTHDGQAVAVVVAVPEAQLAGARRALAGAVTALGTPGEDAVRAAAAAIRHDMLFFSRTPERMAEVLGSFADRESGPDAAQAFYAGLERVDPAAVAAALATLGAQAAATTEVPPQRIRPTP